MTSVIKNFYKDFSEHLSEELIWVNHLIFDYIHSISKTEGYQKFEKFSGLYISDEEINTIINHDDFLKFPGSKNSAAKNPVGQSNVRTLRARVDKKVQNSVSNNVYLSLPELKKRFGLDDFEYQVFLIALAAQVDVRYPKLFAYLQNDLNKINPGVSLILDLFCGDKADRLSYLNYFHPEAALRRFRLIDVLSEAPATVTQQYVSADPRLIYFVLQNDIVDEQVQQFLHLSTPLAWNQVVLNDHLQNRLQMLFRSVLNNPDPQTQRPILYLHGRSGSGKKTVARALGGEIGMPLAVVDLRPLLRNPEDFQDNLCLVLRESLLQPAVTCFDHFEKLEDISEENPTLLKTFFREIHKFGWITLLCSEHPLPAELLELAEVYPVEIPAPTPAEQKILWNTHIGNAGNKDAAATAEQLPVRFDLTGKQISRAVLLARRSAAVRNPENGEVTPADLAMSSRIQSQPKLSSLARKIEPHYRWEQLVLPADQLQQLQELANHVKHKNLVMEDWGFSGKLSLGRGLNALFAGPSGTGKTMAAEVIANELGLDLYKIDLSAVVSKYIGETEKNLNRIFTEAEHSNAILFFDEADALFGKRSEVKDAHDRYSNIEIAYLLQKMEEYDGITILATNLRQNIDEAFTRRIRFIIDFPFPKEE